LQAPAKGHLSKASLQMEWRNSMNYQCTSNTVPGAGEAFRRVGNYLSNDD